MDIATLVEGGIPKAPFSRIAPASPALPVIRRTSTEADGQGQGQGKSASTPPRQALLITSLCNGELPCGRCIQRVDRNKLETCIYEPRLRGGKSDLLKQFADLQIKYDLAKQIFQALLLPDRTPELLERLRSGETYENIVQWLKTLQTEDSPSVLSYDQLRSYYEDSNTDNTGTAGPPLASRPTQEPIAAYSHLTPDQEAAQVSDILAYAKRQSTVHGSFSPQSQGPESDQSSLLGAESAGGGSANKAQILQDLIQENMRLSAQVRDLQAQLKPLAIHRMGVMNHAGDVQAGNSIGG
ncbi:fungal specific transcription factor [Phlyctema vagabunda]|uniref:Fungal specific transcription factor n=1 Tax=Phlyctema vagabunda TaxID=108571 RepID=A0ABR4PVZ2_9HELO